MCRVDEAVKCGLRDRVCSWHNYVAASPPGVKDARDGPLLFRHNVQSSDFELVLSVCWWSGNEGKLVPKAIH